MSGALNARRSTTASSSSDAIGLSAAYPPQVKTRPSSSASARAPSPPTRKIDNTSTIISPPPTHPSQNDFSRSRPRPPPPAARLDPSKRAISTFGPTTTTLPSASRPPSLFGASSLFSASNLAAKALKGVDYVNQNTRTYRSAVSSAGTLLAAQTGLVEPATPEAKDKTWGEWAREWRGKDGPSEKLAVDRLNLMPGWATYMPRDVGKGQEIPGVSSGVRPFDLHVTTAGFTSSLRGPEHATRSQRVFMRIAKSFAALPRLPAEPGQSVLHLPPTITEDPIFSSPLSTPLSEDPVVIHHASHIPETTPPRPNRPRSETMNSVASSAASYRSASTDPFFKDMSDDKLRTLHQNLDTRLQPFWASVSQRRIQLSIYTVPLPASAQRNHPAWHLHLGSKAPEPGPDDEPLVRNVFMTTPQGHWNQKVVIPWERILSHGPSVGLAFAKPPAVPEDLKSDEPPAMNELFGLYIKVELLSDLGPTRSQSSSSVSAIPRSAPAFVSNGDQEDPQEVQIGTRPREDKTDAYFPSPPVTGGRSRRENVGDTVVRATILTTISPNGGVRVISDLDDTVKVSNILSGAREVFRNAFCLPIEETEAPGMSQFYRNLAKDGVSGFHYVSNSPFELLPILTDFFRIHAFPVGFSLRLKYYGGRNLVNGLFEPPGERKRPGLVEIFDAFPSAKFVLFGDSGEQDLELYVALAKERPHQILAVAIRDVTTAFTASIQSQLRRSSGTSTPATARQSPTRSVTASEIDLRALTEALEAEGMAGLDDGVEQASSAGIGGKARDLARKAMGVPSKLDLKKLRLLDDVEDDPAYTGPYDALTGLPLPRETGQDVLASTPDPAETLTTEQRDAEEKERIAMMGVTGSASLSSGAMTDELATTPEEMQTKEEMNALTSQQLKLVRRAAEWNLRRKRAAAQMPSGVKLFFFASPDEVEGEIRELVGQAIKEHHSFKA